MSQDNDGQIESGRRRFLKVLGVSSLGMGAISVLPSAKALSLGDTISNSGNLSFEADNLNFFGGGSSTPDFSIDENGNLQVEGSLDLQQNEAQNMVIDNKYSDPSSPQTGQVWMSIDPTVIEDFEDGNFDDWTNVGSAWSITSTSINGTYSAEKEQGVGPQNNPVQYTGNKRTPEAGDKFEFYQQWMGNSNGAVMCHFGQSDDFSQGYNVRWNPSDNEMRIVKQGVGTLASSSPSGSSGIYRNIIEWHEDGTIVYTVEHNDGTVVDSISATDTDYTSGNIGFRAHGDTRTDSWKIIDSV